MAIIDEKGRLFGKINLLDLVVLLAVLAVAGRFGYKYMAGRNVVPTGEEKTIQMVMKFGAVADPTIKYVTKGTDMLDSKTGNYLGKVVAVRHEPASVVMTSEDGRTYQHLSKDRFDYYVTIEGPARISANGVTMNNLEMKIGRTNFVRTSLWAGYGVTWDFVGLDAK